jgi:hypothetical protein
MMQPNGVPNLPVGIKHAVDALLTKNHVEMPMLHIATVEGVDTVLDFGKSTNAITDLRAIAAKLPVT